MARAPHFVREYNKLMGRMRRTSASDDDAAERAIGGHYETIGARQADLVRKWAPDGDFSLIDMGCGAGRTAYGLREETRLSYLGADVVPDLLAYAQKKIGREDWRFELISDIAIPAADASADMVIFMSVFTHLTPGEIQTYLAEAHRALKPGGVMMASYLDLSDPDHRARFYKPLRNRLSRLIGRDVMVSFTNKNELSHWTREADLCIEDIIDDSPIGQHVLIARKPATS